MKANLGADVNCFNSCNHVLSHHTTLRSRLTLSNLFIKFCCMFDIWHLAIKDENSVSFSFFFKPVLKNKQTLIIFVRGLHMEKGLDH